MTKLILILLLSAAAFAGEHTGTLQRVTAQNGYTDSLRATRMASGDYHVTGDITPAYGSVYFLTTEDGQRIELLRAPLRADAVKWFDKALDGGPIQVQYRVEHPHMGQTFIILVAPDGREGRTYTTDKFDWKAAR